MCYVALVVVVVHRLVVVGFLCGNVCVCGPRSEWCVGCSELEHKRSSFSARMLIQKAMDQRKNIVKYKTSGSTTRVVLPTVSPDGEVVLPSNFFFKK